MSKNHLQGSPRNLSVLTSKAFGTGTLSLGDGVDDLKVLVSRDDEYL